MDEPHPHMQVTFPFDSNIRYLPLVYLIPEDQIVRYPTLNALPRCLSEIAASEPMMDLLDSDAFLKDIMDATAALAFPHFGFGGWKEHYTGYCPVWRLSYALPLWASLFPSTRSKQSPAASCRTFWPSMRARKGSGSFLNGRSREK